MQSIETPSGHLVHVDDDFVQTGSITIGSHGYAQVWDGRTMVLLHRQILGLSLDDGLYGDHINRDTRDNRRENLRIVTASESLLNRTLRARDLPTGVYRHGKRFKAQIKRNCALVHLGVFDTPEEAASSRANAEATF